MDDFATQIAGIEVEQFGLYRPDGSLRPAGELATSAFLAPAGRGDALSLEPDLDRPRVPQPNLVGDWSLALYLAYGIGFSIGALVLALFVLTRRGGRAVRKPTR